MNNKMEKQHMKPSTNTIINLVVQYAPVVLEAISALVKKKKNKHKECNDVSSNDTNTSSNDKAPVQSSNTESQQGTSI